MSAYDYNLLMPFIILAVTSLVCVILIAVKRNRLLTGWAALAGIIAAFISNISISQSGPLPHKIGTLFVIDNFASFFIGLILAGAFSVTAIALGYLGKRKEKSEEFFVLILLVTTIFVSFQL